MFKEYAPAERKSIGQSLKKLRASKVGVLGDIHLYECPLSWITPASNEILQYLYLTRETGALYRAGGWADQPRWFREAYILYLTELKRAQPKPSK